MPTIKIIDDDIELADGLAAIISDAGYTTDTAYDTAGAADALAAAPPDLLVLDVMFPDNPSGGFDLAREIRGRPALKHLPIILLTAINQQFPMGFSTADIDADWMPVQEFIEKPIDPDRLLSAIRRLLATDARP